MLKQRLQQKLLQKLSPQQIQMIKLLEIPTIQIEQRIKKELEENPALEEGADEEEINPPENEEDETVEEKDRDEEEFTLDDYIDDDAGKNGKSGACSQPPSAHCFWQRNND